MVKGIIYHIKHHVHTLLEKRMLKGFFVVPYMEPFIVLKGTTKGSLGTLGNIRFPVHTIERLKVPQRVLGFSRNFFRVQELGFHIRDNKEPF